MLNQKICNKCILDTSVPDIRFDDNGECNYCKIHDEFEKKYPLNELGQQKIYEMIEKIKLRGKNKQYDCVVGLSGGTDSTYCLYLAKKWGLRPLAVHFDNGWNSEIAVNNIKKAITKLDVDLETLVMDWGEFKDLQISFLKASVPDIEIPTDIGIYATLYRIAHEENIPSIINGHSFRTEGTTPPGWTYMDGRYIESVQKEFGKIKLKHFPNLKIYNLLRHIFIDGIREFRPLEYIDYDKNEAGKILEKELGWIYYGGHHFESIYTRFLASYILIKKFGIDKRKVSFSAQIRSGKMTRQEALTKIKENPYPEDLINEDKIYVIKKLGLTKEEFDKIMLFPPKSFLDYQTYYPTIKKLRSPIKLAVKFKLVPEIFYKKYAQ